ncbi:MAG: bifunctional UDP-N-acetylglucosamine diphosphorylase/glucosamine-1-phosphate N-acetyltransferase GlmU [Bdellovibrionota bacterium]
MPSLSVLILAAGRGTRMGASSALPKVLQEAAGRPLLAHVLDAAAGSRPRETIVVGSPELLDSRGAHAGFFQKLLEESGARAALQRVPRGTADAVRAGLWKVRARSGETLVLMGDAPLLSAASLRSLVAAHRRKKALASVLVFAPPDPTGYGRLVRDHRGKPVRIVEEKDLRQTGLPWEVSLRECNTGVWVFNLPWLRRNVRRVKKENAAREFYLTDLLELAAAEGRANALCLERYEEGLGVNTLSELAQASRELRRRRIEELFGAGVVLEDSDRLAIDATVAVGAGTRIAPGVSLRGNTRIGKNCRIGEGAVVVDSQIEDGAGILPYSVIEESRVRKGARVGPLAHLRPGADVGENAHVGNFVELKKTRLGPGAKANHLAYLGDSRVGARANVGAGTITCNYDGEKKYETRIGEGAFIGSDTQLVAPVSVGAGAYVGAGTTVTENVPAGALALSRTKQVNVRGWASRRRKKPKKRK